MPSVRKMKNFLKKHKHFLITSHINPEGDSLGAQLALYKVLKGMGKQCEIVNHDMYSREYLFLPGIGKIRRSPKRKHFDAIIVLDCSNLSRIGNVRSLIAKDTPVLNIDHHVSNALFGTINVIDARASSTCEMLYSIFKRLKISLDKEMAICLFVGIMVDTGSFRYTNTSPATHSIAAHLLRYGVNAAVVYRKVYATLRFSDLQCIAHTLQRIKRDKTGKIAWVVIDQSMFTKYKPAIDLADNVLNFIRLLDGVEVCILFKERLDKRLHIRVNLRSNGAVDVNRIALHFGGGGHKTASGMTLKGITLAQAEDKVIRFVKRKVTL